MHFLLFCVASLDLSLPCLVPLFRKELHCGGRPAVTLTADAEARERLGWVDHPGAIGRELFEPEVVAVVEQQRRCLFVDVEDEARSR